MVNGRSHLQSGMRQCALPVALMWSPSGDARPFNADQLPTSSATQPVLGRTTRECLHPSADQAPACAGKSERLGGSIVKADASWQSDTPASVRSARFTRSVRTSTEQASSAARDCCIRRTLQKSPGARTATPGGGTTAAGARSDKAVASAAATSCSLRLTLRRSASGHRRAFTTGLGGATVSASDAAMLLPPSSRSQVRRRGVIAPSQIRSSRHPGRGDRVRRNAIAPRRPPGYRFQPCAGVCQGYRRGDQT